MYNLHKNEKTIIRLKQISNEVNLEQNDNLLNIKNIKLLSNDNGNKKIKKSQLIKTKKFTNNLYYIYSYLINFFLLEYLLLLLPKGILTGLKYTIQLKLNEIGDQQIFSDEYNITGYYPYRIYVNKEPQILRNKKILLKNTNHSIDIEWNDVYSNLSYMFANLRTITYAKITYMFNLNNMDISYMFYNCRNLQNFSYTGNNDYNENFTATKMFYNCISLTSFVYTNYTEINEINLSYMFYKCEKLNYTFFSAPMIVSDMREMFYNCNSLYFINFTNFKFNGFVNTSYLFYNCYNLHSTINTTLPATVEEIKTNDMKYMFYNCSELEWINSDNLIVDTNISMSYAFYNCKNLQRIKFKNQLNSSSSPTDMQNMFYNCFSLTSIEFPQFITYSNINMTRMFYNCENINYITFENNSLFYPSDLHATFYNCKSLTNLDISDIFITDNVADISYLFYNCSSLTSLQLKFSNLLTTNMRGIFQNCKSIESFELSNFNTSNVKIMWDMFSGCSTIKSLDLSSFDTSKVTDMESMFEGCSNLTKLSLNSFQTSKVQYMNKMFKNCISLTSLNFSNIITTSCGTMHQMFYNCRALTYLNLYNIIERGQSIIEMFDKVSNNFTFCIKEKENIPNIFNILLNMTNAIRDCSDSCYNERREEVPKKKLCCRNLKYEDNCYDKCPSKTHLINNTTKVCEFFNCSSNENVSLYYNYEQDDCTDNISGYYVNDTISNTIDKCHEDCLECNGPSSKVTTNCKKCNNTKPFIYLGNCYENCTPGFYDTNKTKCKCFDTKCAICSEESLVYNLCHTCNKNYYPKENDTTNHNNWINCYHDPEYYFLYDDKIYRQCYPTCRYCEKEGDESLHECHNCTDEFSFGIKQYENEHKQPIYNCYNNCTYYYYFNNSKYQCTPGPECVIEFSKLINGTRECVKNCIETDNKYEYQSTCYPNCPDPSFKNDTYDPYFCKISCPFEEPFEKISEQTCEEFCSIMERHKGECRTNYKKDRQYEVQDLLYNNLQDDIIDSFSTSPPVGYKIINDNFSIILNETNHTYEIITTKKLENRSVIATNTSKIKLGNCEMILKRYYRINETEPLYILKLDAKREGIENDVVQFLVYYPLNGDKLEQLDLTICEGEEIIIIFPTDKTSEDSDLFDIYSDYFNDICYNYTSEDGTDIPLGIRQKLYGDNAQGQCQNGCRFTRFTPDKEVECKCRVDPTQPLVSEMKVDKDVLYQFVDIKNIINFKVMKCYKLLLNIKALLKNVGFFVFIPTFIMFFICMIGFYFNEFKIIKKTIIDIVQALKKLRYLIVQGKIGGEELNEGNYKDPSILKVFRFKRRKVSKNLKFMKDIRQKTTNIQNNIQINININNNKNKLNNTIKEEDNNNDINEFDFSNKNAPPFKNSKSVMKEKMDISGKNINMRNNIMETNNNGVIKKNKINFNLGDINIVDKINSPLNNEEKEFMKRVLRLNDTEMNTLSYREALKYDHRNFIEIYLSLLKTNHMLISIFNKNDYNSTLIKIYLILFSFSTCYGLNALFFDDDTMHDIYYQKGEYSIMDQAPQIIYSSILSYILDNLFNFLALSGDDALSLKHEKIITKLNRIKEETIVGFQLKFAFFFILSFISLMFFWYYITCFCAVYANTQIHLLSDSLISFGSSLLTPFAIYLIAPLLRITSLKTKSKTNEMIYNLSKIVTSL